MSLDLDPVYHTTTMVKILRDQGCSQHAMELAEVILAQEGENETVHRILKELKDEAKKAFERFKNSGRLPERAIPSEPEPGTEEDEEPEAVLEASHEGVHLSLVSEPPIAPISEQGPSTGQAPVSSSVLRLQELLQRIERNRRQS